MWRRLSSWTKMSKNCTVLIRLSLLSTLRTRYRASTSRSLKARRTSRVEQLVFADRIILNKCDLLLTEQLKTDMGGLEANFLQSDGTECVHDEGVSSVSWKSPGLELNVNRLLTWISSLMQELGTELFWYNESWQSKNAWSSSSSRLSTCCSWSVLRQMSCARVEGRSGEATTREVEA